MWTEERDETLKTMLAGGATVAQAAAKIGVTRNAAMGRASRRGFAMNAPKNGGWNEKRKEDARAVRRAKAERKNPLVFKVSAPKPPKPMVQRPTEAAPSLRLTVMDLRDNDCHFIEGERPYTYCGYPAIELRPYCMFHAALVYQPVRARTS